MDNSDLKKKIQEEIIKPTYLNDIQSTIKWRNIYRKCGNVNVSLSKLFVMIGSILAFCESYFKTEYLSLISGSVSLVGVLLQQYSEFAYKESTKRTLETNELLASLGLETIPDITDDKYNVPNHGTNPV